MENTVYAFPDIIAGASKFYSYTEKLSLIQSPEMRHWRSVFVILVVIIITIIITTTAGIIIII